MLWYFCTTKLMYPFFSITDTCNLTHPIYLLCLQHLVLFDQDLSCGWYTLWNNRWSAGLCQSHSSKFCFYPEPYLMEIVNFGFKNEWDPIGGCWVFLWVIGTVLQLFYPFKYCCYLVVNDFARFLCFKNTDLEITVDFISVVSGNKGSNLCNNSIWQDTYSCKYQRCNLLDAGVINSLKHPNCKKPKFDILLALTRKHKL